MSDDAPVTAGPVVRVRMIVAYDGSGFHGFAPNPGVRTVGGLLAEVIGKIMGRPVELTCAGRTDAGVHAWGQVVSFDAPVERFDPAALQRAVNGQCAPAIVVRDIAEASPEFDARHSAVRRIYRYTVVNRAVPDPFLAHVAWHVPQPLELALLRLASDPLVGEHDFSAFCRKPRTRGGPEPSLVRTVHRAEWTDLGDGILRFELEANAFCHQMVRSLTGTLVDVGLGRKQACDMLAILASGQRARASSLAPPHGLCLWAVRYDALSL